MKMTYTVRKTAPLLFLLVSFLTAASQSIAQSADPKIPQSPIPGIPVNCSTLLDELLDREHLAHYPKAGWTLHHASSYERLSVTKDSAGWFANNDWDHYIRVEDNAGHKEYVMMDADGPGVITRLWAAGTPGEEGHLRFYIDGQSTPFWDAAHWGELVGQNRSIGAPLSERSVEQDYLPINKGAQPGHNLYAPIPFRHHIKITYDRKPGGPYTGLWYNIDYRTYPPGTDLESFSAAATVKYADQLHRTNETLNAFMAKPSLTATAPGEKKVKNVSFALAPGASRTVELSGMGSIRRLLLSLAAGAPDRGLGGMKLQMAFDDQPAVDLPAGFLFGCGDQLVPSGNWYSKTDSNGNMSCYWIMPYRHKAVIRLVNEGSGNVSGSLAVATGNWRWDSRSMYFHAGFKNRLHFSVPSAEKGIDIGYLDLQNATGIYVGDVLEVKKTTGGWWGEGDEKIYVDGSTFPTDFGTGSEDYYGYAWGHPETFNHVFNTQPAGNANLSQKGGITVDTRVRDLDAIPFDRSFRFDLESLWTGAPLDLAWACFWYQK